METNNINYSFIAVPTQLFILLDYRLKLVLTSLIQVSTALANSNGWFYYSKEDLKKLCGIKNDKTIIACLETFYRLNLLEVQARTFKNNVGSRTANYYRINFTEIEKYNEYSVYECMNIPELQIAMLDYTSSDYKTTYTATTVVDTNEEEIKPISVQNDTNEEIPTSELENAPTALETSNPANVEEYTLSEVDEDDEIPDSFLDENGECPLTKEEILEALEYSKEVVETASVIPNDLNKVEKRSISTNEKTNKLDESIRKKCADLVQRYVEMVIPNSNESVDKCNQALRYITDKYNKGYIDIMDRDRFCREVINARFIKHSI